MKQATPNNEAMNPLQFITLALQCSHPDLSKAMRCGEQTESQKGGLLCSPEVKRQAEASTSAGQVHSRGADQAR